MTKFLGYAYRFFSNFIFLAMVYYSLNFMDKYAQRATLAIMILLYAAMRATSAFHSFHFFQRIERLELEARRLSGLAGEGPGAATTRKAVDHRSLGAASFRRDEELYRPAVSRAGHLAVHFEDRDRLSRQAFRFFLI